MNLKKIMSKHMDKPHMKKLDAFQLVVLGGKSKPYAAKELGMTPDTIRNWSKEPWWQEAHDEYAEMRHKAFNRKFKEMAPDILDHVYQSVKSADPNKQLGAMVNMLKIVSEGGSNPFIQKKGMEVNVMNDNRSINFGEVDMEKVRSAPSHIKKEIARGNIPVEYRKRED